MHHHHERLLLAWIDKKMDPFAALASFIVSKDRCLLASADCHDATLALLYNIMEEMIREKVKREIQLLDALSAIYDSSVKQFNNIIDTSERLGYSSSITKDAEKGKDSIISVKRQLLAQNEGGTRQKIMRTGNKIGNKKHEDYDEKRYIRTMQFVHMFKETRKKMDWKVCYKMVADKKDLIQYANPETLRVRYWPSRAEPAQRVNQLKLPLEQHCL